MTSDLFVSFSGCCTFLKVHTFQNCVLAEPFFYADNRFLHLLLVFKSLPFGLLSLFLFNRIIEKRYLLGNGFVFYIAFSDELAGCNRNTANKQILVYNAVNRFIVASVMMCDEDVFFSKFAVPCACFGTLRL